ncbi:hypothetical protein [Nonomuraea sp. PA05]|nr:hypothetical protein [Nonomuraea sp. PA05]
MTGLELVRSQEELATTTCDGITVAALYDAGDLPFTSAPPPGGRRDSPAR